MDKQQRLSDLVVPLVISEVNRLLSPRWIHFLVALNIALLICTMFVFAFAWRVSSNLDSHMQTQDQWNTSMRGELKALGLVDDFRTAIEDNTAAVRTLTEEQP